MRTPQYTLARIFENLAALDHNDINTLSALKGQMVTIPVSLQYKEKPVASGTVTLTPLRKRMEYTAVYLLENTLKSHGMHVFWDKAIAGKDKITVNPGTYLFDDPLAHEMPGQDRSISLRDNLAMIKENYDHRRNHGGIPPTPFEEGLDLAAAIVAHTATIKSPDLEKFLFDKKAAFGSYFMGFRPRGVEF